MNYDTCLRGHKFIIGSGFQLIIWKRRLVPSVRGDKI